MPKIRLNWSQSSSSPGDLRKQYKLLPKEKKLFKLEIISTHYLQIWYNFVHTIKNNLSKKEPRVIANNQKRGWNKIIKTNRLNQKKAEKRIDKANKIQITRW